MSDQPNDQADGEAVEEELTVVEQLQALLVRDTRIRECERLFRVAVEEEEDAKIEYDARKKLTIASQKRLNRSCGRDEEEQMDLPLEAADETADAWKSVAISDIGFTAGAIASMQDEQIDTIGQLAAWQQDGRKKLTDLKGVGPGSAEKIETALEQWWSANQNYTRPAVESATTPDEVLAVGVLRDDVDAVFNPQCGHVAPQHTFSIRTDGEGAQWYICPACKVEFPVATE